MKRISQKEAYGLKGQVATLELKVAELEANVAGARRDAREWEDSATELESELNRPSHPALLALTQAIGEEQPYALRVMREDGALTLGYKTDELGS